MTISNNAGTDFYNETRRKIYAKGTVGEMEGKFQTWDLANRIVNNDLMVTYEKTFDDFGIKGIFGHNINQREWTNNNTLANGLIVDGLYTYTKYYTAKNMCLQLYTGMPTDKVFHRYQRLHSLYGIYQSSGCLYFPLTL